MLRNVIPAALVCVASDSDIDIHQAPGYLNVTFPSSSTYVVQMEMYTHTLFLCCEMYSLTWSSMGLLGTFEEISCLSPPSFICPFPQFWPSEMVVVLLRVVKREESFLLLLTSRPQEIQTAPVSQFLARPWGGRGHHFLPRLLFLFPQFSLTPTPKRRRRKREKSCPLPPSSSFRLTNGQTEVLSFSGFSLLRLPRTKVQDSESDES